MMKWGLSSGTPADSYYEVRSDCTDDVPKSKFKIKAGKTLSARKWHAAFSPDGCLDIASVLSRIQRGVRFLIFWSYCFSVSYMLLVLQMSNYILSVMFTPINMIHLLLGCASNSQGEVWEFLLGCFDPRSTFDEREEIRQIRRYLLP